jgi:hypothetical protein
MFKEIYKYTVIKKVFSLWRDHRNFNVVSLKPIYMYIYESLSMKGVIDGFFPDVSNNLLAL